MKTILKNVLEWFDQNLFRWMVIFFYPRYNRPRHGYLKHYQVLWQYFFMQKVVGFNRFVPWPVDFRTKIRGWKFIEKGIMCDPGDNTGIYINAYGGLKMGDNVGISSNTVIVTTNHDKYDHRKIGKKRGVTIGSNVWIGANCTILPGTHIGDEVTIGAGCVISGVIPSKSTVVRGENHIKITPKTIDYQWDIRNEKLT